MRENEPTPVAKADAGITQEAHDAAIGAARAEGAADANKRMAAVMSADSIKGDGGRMAAALDLATKSPEMSADDVTAFVTSNVAAAGTVTVAEFEAGKAPSAGAPAMPQGKSQQPSSKSEGLSASAIYARRNAQT